MHHHYTLAVGLAGKVVIKVAERQGLTTPSTSVQHRARLKCRYTIVHVTRKGDLAGPQAGLFFLTEGYRPLHRGRQPRVLKRNPSAIEWVPVIATLALGTCPRFAPPCSLAYSQPG